MRLGFYAYHQPDSFDTNILFMSNKTVSLNLYQDWYKEMETALAEFETGWDSEADYFRQIDVVRSTIQKLQEPYAPGFEDVDMEVIYHRAIWPRFYSKLFFYQLAQRFCYQRHIQPSRPLSGLIEKEIARIDRFFSRHRVFWADYLYGVDFFSEQFTREYSKYDSLQPLHVILDAAGGTVAGYRVAWGLAYEEYRLWLRGVEESCLVASAGVYEWKETKSAAAEFIKSQVEAGSVHINGKPATAAQLRADFEQRYHVSLKDFDNLLYAMDTLKVDETPYLSKLKERFMAWKKRLGK